MAYLADAHREWHYVNGWDTVCPLDCGVEEARYADWDAEQEEAEEAHHIVCGSCKDLHETVEEVRACHALAF